MRDSGGFSLQAEPSRPAPPRPACDLLDPDIPLTDVGSRSVRNVNATAGIHFRHQTWDRDRRCVYQALLPPDLDPHAWIRYANDPNCDDFDYAPQPTRRALRFAACGSKSVVMQSADDPSRYKVACERCHDRFCLPCMQDRARLIVANLKAQLPYEPTRFLTLTLKHSDAPLTEQLDRLYTSFACLRRRRFWQDRVTGGIAFLELKLSHADERWHPHLHVLLRGKYLPQKAIADSWFEITGDSFIVDVRMARDPDHLYSYLTRYVTKGWDRAIYRGHHKLVEAIEALHGRKLLCGFGSFRNLKLLAPPNVETWLTLGTIHEIATLSECGVNWAVEAWAALTAKDWTSPVSDVPPDP